MKQILNLRKELAKACNGEVALDKLPLQTFMLLESVNRSIDPLVLANVLRTMIPDNSIFLTKDDLINDEQNYFACETDDESIVVESGEEEKEMAPPNKRRRKNSVEIFTSAKEKLESMGYGEEYLLAALQSCGRHATEDEIVVWVVSQGSEEVVAKMCEDAKENPNLAILLEDLGYEHQVVNNDEKIATTFNGYVLLFLAIFHV